MKTEKISLRSFLAFILLLALSTLTYAQSDPLPSWNDGANKRAIVDFVVRVTKEGSPDFVAAPQRIATFDNDGTLWSEQPIYFQFAFALDRVKELASQHPEWKTTQPFEFMRVWTEKIYGIPPEQVVGTSFVTKFQMGSDGKPLLLREPKVDFIDDGPGKPVGIQKFIGRRPILAFGNSDADQQMLEWTAAGSGARFVGTCSSHRR
jgi:hypothetical protein